MKKYFFSIILAVSAFLMLTAQKADISAPEKTIKLFYEAIDEFDRVKLAACFRLTDAEVKEYYFGDEKGRCMHTFKISAKKNYDRASAEKENKGRGEMIKIEAGDVYMAASTITACKGESYLEMNHYFWLRKYDGVWKIYDHATEADD